jgi:hypothetical protein
MTQQQQQHAAAGPLTTDLERRADDWIAPFRQVDHLRATHRWLLELDPEADLALRVAALTHDMERHYPAGSPKPDLSWGWDDAEYLIAHSTRSADIVGWWLHDQMDEPDDRLAGDVRRLILLHELGGNPRADLLQAADSLSWFETNSHVVVGWLESGYCTLETGIGKHRFMLERIRLPRARELAAPLHERALSTIEAIA